MTGKKTIGDVCAHLLKITQKVIGLLDGCIWTRCCRRTSLESRFFLGTETIDVRTEYFEKQKR